MVSLLENLFLQFRTFNLIVIKNDVFTQRLHSKYLFGILFLNKKNLTETASSNNFAD